MQEGVVCRDTRGWGKELICYVYVKPASFSCCKLCDLSFIVKSINDCETRPLLLDVAQSRTSLSVIKELGFDWNSAWYVFLKKGSSVPKINPCRVAFSLTWIQPYLPCDSLRCPLPALVACGALYLPPENVWCLPVIVRRNTKISVFQASQRKNQGDSLGLKKAFPFRENEILKLFINFRESLYLLESSKEVRFRKNVCDNHINISFSRKFC
jgi:hypothetical protein